MKESGEAARGSVRFEEVRAGPARGPFAAFRGRAAARSQERATANSRPPPNPVICYLTFASFAFALAAAAAVAEGSAKAITASPSVLIVAGLPPKG